MKFQPTQDKILIKPDDADKRTDGGLFIPDSAQEQAETGVIIAVGPGAIDLYGKQHEPRVKKKERVMFAKNTGVAVKLDGVEHRLVREADVFGVLGD